MPFFAPHFPKKPYDRHYWNGISESIHFFQYMIKKTVQSFTVLSMLEIYNLINLVNKRWTTWECGQL